MKKRISFLLVVTLLLSMMSFVHVNVNAARVNTCYPYILGEEAEYEYVSMSEYHKFEITKRTKVKVELSVPQEQESTYNGDVDFYFERKKDGDVEDVDSSKYFDYKEKFVVERGATVEEEITLQPGKYYLVVSQGSLYKYRYKFKLSVVDEVETPTYPDVVKNGNDYEVSYEIGTEFKAHNYQYERSDMYFYFTVPYKTQFDFMVRVDKDEYYSSYTYKHYDTVTIQRNNNSDYDPYKDVKSYVVNPGEIKNESITLEEGQYRIKMKSNNGNRGDFALKLTKGSLEATEIAFKNDTETLERGVSTYILPITTPKEGTAELRFESSDINIATVNDKGWVTGVKDGTTTITAYLQNGASASYKLVVKEMKAVAEVVDQKSFYAYHNKNIVYLNFTPYKDTYTDAIYISELDTSRVKRTFKIYRSTKKNGKYTQVGTVTYDKTLGYEEFVDKKVKANTRYYYKTQVKVHGDGDFGPMSKAMEFWTAPKPKVKIKSNTLKKASWKKVKGVTGYLATEGCVRFVGYNIFGQELRDSITAAKLVKGTKYKKKYYSVSKSNKKSKSSLKVTTYSKHGKYYYVSGRLITKNKGDLEILKVRRIVG